MTNNINQNVKEVLADQEKIKEFAELNRLTVEAAELLLKRLMESTKWKKSLKNTYSLMIEVKILKVIRLERKKVIKEGMMLDLPKGQPWAC